jgi:hypothetical protein
MFMVVWWMRDNLKPKLHREIVRGRVRSQAAAVVNLGT